MTTILCVTIIKKRQVPISRQNIACLNVEDEFIVAEGDRITFEFHQGSNFGDSASGVSGHD